MRPSRFLLAAVVSLPVLCLPVSLRPAEAVSPPRPYLVDLVGDANGANDQGFELPLPETGTAPASWGRADIQSVSLKTVWQGTGKSRKPNGLLVTMTLAEPPADGVIYEATLQWSGTCDGLRSELQVYYQLVDQLSNGVAKCQVPGNSNRSNDVLADLQVDARARTVSWRTRATIPRGAEVWAMTADTSVAFFGQLDKAAADGTWTYGG